MYTAQDQGVQLKVNAACMGFTLYLAALDPLTKWNRPQVGKVGINTQ